MIDLPETLGKGGLYSLSSPARTTTQTYIESLATGFIHPLSSSAGAGYFFVVCEEGQIQEALCDYSSHTVVFQVLVIDVLRDIIN